jgi:hypothetical protein
MNTNRVSWELLRTFDTSTITSAATYYPVGGPLLNPSYICKLVNNSNILVTVSIDGINDYDVAPAGSFFLYDEAKELGHAVEFLPAGTQISVRFGGFTGTAGVGLIYFVSQYIVQS